MDSEINAAENDQLKEELRRFRELTSKDTLQRVERWDAIGFILTDSSFYLNLAFFDKFSINVIIK